MKNFILTILVVASLLMMTACPKAQRLHRTAKEASAQIQFQTLKLIEANIEGYKSGVLSLERKDRIAVLTGNLQQGINIYRKALKETEPFINKNGQLPKDKMEILRKIFDQQVAAKFSAFLTELKLLSPEQSALFQTAVATIQLAISTITGTFAEAAIMQRRSVWV